MCTGVSCTCARRDCFVGLRPPRNDEKNNMFRVPASPVHPRGGVTNARPWHPRCKRGRVGVSWLKPCSMAWVVPAINGGVIGVFGLRVLTGSPCVLVPRWHERACTQGYPTRPRQLGGQCACTLRNCVAIGTSVHPHRPTLHARASGGNYKYFSGMQINLKYSHRYFNCC